MGIPAVRMSTDPLVGAFSGQRTDQCECCVFSPSLKSAIVGYARSTVMAATSIVIGAKPWFAMPLAS